MPAASTLIPELEEAIQRGTPERQVVLLQRMTALFMGGASRFNADHVRVFDDVFMRLIDEIETKARAELAQSLAGVDNAPVRAVQKLARDDDISVAKPILEQSQRLGDADLIDIAETKSQAHLLAISVRNGIAEPVTDVLVRRGDRDVARSVAENRTARLSEGGISALVHKAEQDAVLAEKVGSREDVPLKLFRDLLDKAADVVLQRLLSSVGPERKADIQRVLSKVSRDISRKSGPRDFDAATRIVVGLRREGKLNEAQLVEFAKAGQYEEMIAALAQLCSVPIDVVLRLMAGERPDPILILCRAEGWEWQTARAIIMARPKARTSSEALDTAFSNFERLSASTAQRVIRFWQAPPRATG